MNSAHARFARLASPRPGEPAPSAAPLRWRAAGVLAFALVAVSFGPLRAQAPTAGPAPIVGPERGTLIVAGGGELGTEIWETFVRLAGGEAAKIVVIPTAAADEDLPYGWRGLDALRAAGIKELVLLHTRDPSEADDEAFIEPLRDATGVWLPGGRPWRLVDAYLHTKVHEELFALLDRGGVVGGTSAGASIQASFLMRGDPDTNRTVYSPEYLEGFGFLEQVAVDQHLLARGRETDLWKVLDRFPELLGIGLDEGTALVVQGNRAEVIGGSQVLLYDPKGPSELPARFGSGSLVDLGARAPLELDGSGRVGAGATLGDDC